MRVTSGLAALTAHRYLVTSSARADRSLERLASGLRINRAADDAAGLAVSEGLRSQVGGGGCSEAIAHTLFSAELSCLSLFA